MRFPLKQPVVTEVTCISFSLRNQTSKRAKCLVLVCRKGQGHWPSPLTGSQLRARQPLPRAGRYAGIWRNESNRRGSMPPESRVSWMGRKMPQQGEPSSGFGSPAHFIRALHLLIYSCRPFSGSSGTRNHWRQPGRRPEAWILPAVVVKRDFSVSRSTSE